jgi:hypothetical protein
VLCHPLVFKRTINSKYLKKNWNEKTGQFWVFEKAESKNWLILDVINPQRTAGFHESTAGSLQVVFWLFQFYFFSG